MDLSLNERSILLVLTNDWQSPIQIAALLPNGDPDNVNHALKDLINKGYTQVNPIIFGMYRLTSDGSNIKANLLGE